MDYPDLSYPRGLFARVALDTILLRRRNFRLDAKACIENLHPPLRVLGNENIPQQGPCVLTVNHYHRVGFSAEWLAFAIAAVVPVDMQWVMTGEFLYSGKWYERFGAIGSQFLLRRLAWIYGFTTMPPMPPRAKDVEARAASVRAVFNFVRNTKAPVLGLAPEGYDPPSGVLVRPPSGLGRFALLLSKAGMKFIPVGAYEAEGSFQINFGKSYLLVVPRDLPPHEKDNQAIELIMKTIAGLLPAHLRGEFA